MHALSPEVISRHSVDQWQLCTLTFHTAAVCSINYANIAHSEFLVNFIYLVFSERKLELVNGDHLSIPGMRDYPYASIENYNQMSPSPKPVTPLSPSAGSLPYNVGELSFLL